MISIYELGLTIRKLFVMPYKSLELVTGITKKYPSLYLLDDTTETDVMELMLMIRRS